MEYEDLLLEKKEEGIAILTLNAPEKLNALTTKMGKSLPLAINEIAEDDEVRVVIVTGAGRAFCAGGDVKAMAGIEGTRERSRYERFLQLVGQNWSYALMRLNKPVIAAINGPAVGAGFSIALSCDIRIASEEAKFGSLFILRGLIPDSGLTYLLPRTVGTAKALELMYTGELFNATKAEQLGIVSRVVPGGELMKVVLELAVRISEQPPIALELTKKLVYRSMVDDVVHHLDGETYALRMCFGTEDFKEAARAFVEKRPRPKFKGK